MLILKYKIASSFKGGVDNLPNRDSSTQEFLETTERLEPFEFYEIFELGYKIWGLSNKISLREKIEGNYFYHFI